MDSNTLIVGFLLSLLANIVSDTYKFLLKSRNREKIKSKFRTDYYFSFEQAERAQYFVLESLLFTLPSYLNYIYGKSIQTAQNLSLLSENLKSHIRVLFDRDHFNSITIEPPISYPQLLPLNSRLEDSIIQKVVTCGRMSDTALAKKIGLGIRASDLKPELDYLVVKGILRRRESGELGCWHGIQIYELAR